MDETPEAYRYGWQPFFGLHIHLDSKPLIPRPETEWWAEQLFIELEGHVGMAASAAPSRQVSETRVSQRDGARGGDFSAEKYAALVEGTVDSARYTFLDLCAGSGAIGCAALKALPHAEVYFGEIDPAHEATILKNIRENNLDASRAHVSIGDLFEPFADISFDVIAINPPYIPADRALDRSVADYEPALALRSGADGLDLIRRIALELPKHLAPSGIAWIEVDSPSAEAARALFATQGLKAEIRTDQYDRPRVIVVSFP
ncbi:MAG: methyltransferase [Candidatus Pacebacteria bacterium]|nr:methyltransferase [Candidatus Paceibacterota bacterium]